MNYRHFFIYSFVLVAALDFFNIPHVSGAVYNASVRYQIDSLIEVSKASLTSQPEQVRPYIQKALQLAEENQLDSLLSEVYRKLGVTYQYTSTYDKAIYFYLKSLRMAEKLDDKENIFYALHNLSSVSIDMKDMKEAKRYINVIRQRFDTLTSLQQMRLSNNLGIIYKTQHNYDSALIQYKKVLKLAKELHISNTLSIALHNIGTLYSQKQQYEIAQQYLDSSAVLAKKDNNQLILANDYIDLAELYLQKKAYSLSQAYVRSALEISKRTGIRKTESSCYNVLCQINEAKHNYKTALKYSKLYQETQDTILNIEKAHQIAILKSNYRATQHENEMLLLKKDNELKTKELTIKESTLRENDLIIFSLVLAIILSVMFIIVIIKYLRIKDKANNKLKTLNKTILKQASELHKKAEALRKANSEIQAINSSLEKTVEERTKKIQEQSMKIVEYTVFNAHKIRGPLASIKGLVNLIEIDSPEEDLKKVALNLKKSTLELDENLHKINQLLSDDDSIQDTNMSDILKKINLQ